MLVNGIERVLNWRPGRPDFRDKKFMPRPGLLRDTQPLPTSVGALDLDIPIWDQGQLGSCTAHGTGCLWSHRLLKEGKGLLMPSRLFIYYCEREIEGSTEYDNGALVRDGLKAMASYGVPLETFWPYDISQFASRPPQKVYDIAVDDIALEYATVPMEEKAIKLALAEGNPTTFGFTVFDSFNDIGADGIMRMPSKSDSEEGGHCVAFVGYDDSKRAFLVRNSWGTGWGLNGRFWMPYENLVNCDDGWVLTSVK